MSFITDNKSVRKAINSAGESIVLEPKLRSWYKLSPHTNDYYLYIVSLRWAGKDM